MVTRDLGVTIEVKRDIVMWHTVLIIGGDRRLVGVGITNDPLSHKHFAQVVMHKTRSHNCAIQVARYVRRRFEITEPVQTVNVARPREAMIGYACTSTAQYPPDERTPGWGVFQHIAATPIKRLLEEVADGHNAARTRYVVYEVRCARRTVGRGITHKFNALERRYREAPPDTLDGPIEFVQISRHATQAEALVKIGDHDIVGDALWTRKPSVDYMRRVLRIDGDDIVWTCDGSAAVRRYDFDAVCVGPHVYTEFQVRHLLEHGEWIDGRTEHGRRIRYG